MPTSPDSTELFLRYSRQRDPDALAEVFDRTAPVLLRIARRLAGNLPDAEDLVQETFVAALESARRFRGGNLDAWLTAILERRARRLHRRRRRGGPTDEPAALDPGPGPDESVASRDACAYVAEAIDRLGEPYRSVLRLRMRHGFTAAQIGVALERSAETVQSQLRRGLETLRQRVGAGALGAAAVLTDDAPRIGRLKQQVLVHAARPVATAKLTGVGVWLAAAGLAALVTLAAIWPRVTRGAPLRSEVGTPTLAARATLDDRTTAARRTVEVATSAPTVPDSDDPFATMRITVVDDATDRPVPNATVLFHDDAAPDLRDQYLSYPEYHRVWIAARSTPEPVLRRHGRATVTAADGTAMLPIAARFGSIVARSADRYGVRWWQQDESLVIRIADSRSLEVHVRDADGAPVVGLDVDLGDPDDSSLGSLGASRRATTDVRGIARFTEVQDLQRVLRSLGRNTVALHVRMPLPEVRAQPVLQVDRWPIGPLEIVVPRTGVLHVRRLASDGGTLPRGDAYDDLRLSMDGSGPGMPISLEDGEATIRLVPVGRDLQLSNDRDDVLQLPPLDVGEVRRVDFVVGRHAFTVVGRALDAHGAPAGGAVLESTGVMETSSIECDRDGAFALAIAPEEASAGGTLRLWRRQSRPFACGIPWQERRLAEFAEVAVTPATPGGVQRLGDVRFAVPRRRWTGRVTLDTGGDVGDLAWVARFHLESWQHRDGAAAPDFAPCEDGVVQLDPDGRLTVAVLDGITGPFRLRIDGGFADLALRNRLLPSDPIPLPGEGGAVDVLLRVGARVEWICEDPTVDRPHVELHPLARRSGTDRPLLDLEASGGDWRPATRAHRVFVVDGAFRAPIAPGRYRMTVRRAGPEGLDVLAEFPELLLAPGSIVRVPRL